MSLLTVGNPAQGESSDVSNLVVSYNPRNNPSLGLCHW